MKNQGEVQLCSHYSRRLYLKSQYTAFSLAFRGIGSFVHLGEPILALHSMLVDRVLLHRVYGEV